MKKVKHVSLYLKKFIVSRIWKQDISGGELRICFVFSDTFAQSEPETFSESRDSWSADTASQYKAVFLLFSWWGSSKKSKYHQRNHPVWQLTCALVARGDKMEDINLLPNELLLEVTRDLGCSKISGLVTFPPSRSSGGSPRLSWASPCWCARSGLRWPDIASPLYSWCETEEASGWPSKAPWANEIFFGSFALRIILQDP